MKKILSPLFERPDLTPYLIHLTKRSKDKTAFENLLNILREGQINGSGNSGYVKGKNIAACFMDMPFQALKNLLIENNRKGDEPRYEPYGIFYTKNSLYNDAGARPVLYLSDLELKTLGIPEEEHWRVVKFDLGSQYLTSWIHEREWRIKGDFSLEKPAGILVKTAAEAQHLNQLIHNQPKSFKSTPYVIIPLELICQGLPYSDKNL